MYLVYGKIELFLPQASSLKDKRQTLQSIINRMRNRFNISICELNYQELWQRSVLGFAAVCSTNRNSEFILQMIENTLDNYADVCEILEFNYEIENY